jgi:ribonuclease HI
MSKFYAVANGYKTGIFNSWDVAKSLVSGFSGAKYKSFKTLEEAQKYLTDYLYPNNPVIEPKSEKQIPHEQKKELFAKEIIAYTDGSCVKQVGGFGYVVIINNTEVPMCGKVPSFPTTNQVAELYAIYSLISYLLQNHKKDILVNVMIVRTDSKYSIGCLTEWYNNWMKNGWINSKNEPVANKELIQAILNISKGLNIKYEHVKAHNGDKYNEWADKLANEGRL